MKPYGLPPPPPPQFRINSLNTQVRSPSGASQQYRAPGDAFTPAVPPVVALTTVPRGDPNSKSVNEAFPGMNLSRYSSVDDLKAMIRQDIWVSGGREANDKDYEYWLPKLQGECDSGYVTRGEMSGIDYWHNRLLGWQAGGADTATGGPYAGMDFGSLESPTVWPFDQDPSRLLIEAFSGKRKKKVDMISSALPPPGDYKMSGFADVQNATGVDSLKADAFEVVRRIDPNDPEALAKAIATLDKVDPGGFKRDGNSIRLADHGSISAAGGAWTFKD